MSNREARTGSVNPDQSVKSPDDSLARLTRFGFAGEILSLSEEGWSLDYPGRLDLHPDYNPALRVIDPSDEMTFARLTRHEGEGDHTRTESVVMTFTGDGRVFICGRGLTFGGHLLETGDPFVNEVQQAFLKRGLSSAVENPLSHSDVERGRLFEMSRQGAPSW